MLPKHHKTSFFLKSGLFNNLTCFAELEKRISKLPTTVEEGDAFEVFAEAYFFTQKIEQAEEVWPFKSIPSRIKENLSLGTNQQGMGVDGVFKTVSDEFNAYQAKFRTDRVSLTWSELSTFMGLTDKVSQRVLFTNSNDITSVINERTGFYCIRGNDLDRLDRNDFKTILRWLQSGVLEVERKAPQPHQDEAIRDILNALKDEDRATALMACGTGKTLVALWISERMDCQNILVLLPSLILVRQSLHEWLRETQWQHLSYLCVCSDPTVVSKELDSIKINQSDLDFAVTTDSSTVRQFLSQSAKGVKIVFSTYQSTHIVTEGMDDNYRFDLGIFDEAHKTAGRESIINEFKGSDFSVISNARCLTEGVDLPSVDMVAFMSPKKSKVDIVQATGRAMRKGPRNPDKISGYILIPLYLEIATGESIEDAVAKAGFEEVWDVLQALQEHDEVLADTIRQIQEDKGKGRNGGVIVDSIDVIGVDISLKTLQESITAVCIEKLGFTWDFRYGELIKYKEQYGDCKVPKRWAENKQLGKWVGHQRTNYQKGKLGEDRIKRLEDIGFVWEKLESRWEEMFIALTEYKNKFGDCNVPSRWTENKQLGMWVSGQRKNHQKGRLSEDRIKLLEDIGFVWEKLESKWEGMFTMLKEYKDRHGVCNVPDQWAENKQLGMWVGTQRKIYKKGDLSKDRIKRLEEIGFVWNIRK